MFDILCYIISYYMTLWYTTARAAAIQLLWSHTIGLVRSKPLLAQFDQAVGSVKPTTAHLQLPYYKEREREGVRASVHPIRKTPLFPAPHALGTSGRPFRSAGWPPCWERESKCTPDSDDTFSSCTACSGRIGSAVQIGRVRSQPLPT